MPDLKPGDLFDLTIAVDALGKPAVIDCSESWRPFLGGSTSAMAGCIEGLPAEPGVYNIVAEYWWEDGHADGDGDGVDPAEGWTVVSVESVRLVPSGCVEQREG
jgi:hypothetical protein